MQKLTLNVESLRVDSFEVDGQPSTPRGTVRGAMNIQTVTTCEYTANCDSGGCNEGSAGCVVWTSPYTCTGCVAVTGDCHYDVSAAC
jgi:hypothetical protein